MIYDLIFHLSVTWCTVGMEKVHFYYISFLHAPGLSQIPSSSLKCSSCVTPWWEDQLSFSSYPRMVSLGLLTRQFTGLFTSHYRSRVISVQRILSVPFPLIPVQDMHQVSPAALY